MYIMLLIDNWSLIGYFLFISLFELYILNIEETKSNQFVLDLLGFHAYNLRHATLSLISIISATYKGVEYLMSNGPSIVEKIIDIMKGVENATH